MAVRFGKTWKCLVAFCGVCLEVRPKIWWIETFDREHGALRILSRLFVLQAEAARVRLLVNWSEVTDSVHVCAVFGLRKVCNETRCFCVWVCR